MGDETLLNAPLIAFRLSIQIMLKTQNNLMYIYKKKRCIKGRKLINIIEPMVVTQA